MNSNLLSKSDKNKNVLFFFNQQVSITNYKMPQFKVLNCELSKILNNLYILILQLFKLNYQITESKR